MDPRSALLIGAVASFAIASGPIASTSGLTPSLMATDAVEVAWTAPPLEATTRAVPTFVATLDDAVFVAGGLDGTLSGQTSLGSADGFVARYDASGSLQWARHVGTAGTDYLTALVVTPSGVFVGGRSNGPPNGTISGRDGFVASLTLDGDSRWHFAQYDSHDIPVRLAAMPDGGVIAGMTGYVSLPAGDSRRPLFYRHFRPDGTVAWEDEFLGWWTDDVEVDASGITVSGQRLGVSGGEAFVRRYTHVGAHVWTRAVTSEFGRDVRVWEIASTPDAIWAAGVGLVPIDDSPDAWPDDHRFVRRLAIDGATVWTKAINPHRLIRDCGMFIGIGEAVAQEPSARQGGYIARFESNGSEAWRWTEPGNSTTRINFNDIAVRGGRGYLIREAVAGTEPADVRLVALDNLPSVVGCDPSDTTPPTATAPTHRLVNGTAITGGRTTVRIAWSGADSMGTIARYELAQSTGGGSWTTVSSTLRSPGLDRGLAHGHSYRFRVRAIDSSGNVSGWMPGSTFRLTHFGESSSAIRYSGTWATATSSVYWGGKARSSSRAGSRATLTFTGRSVELVSRKGPTRGKAQIYVNGVLKATIDLYAASFQNQRVVWTGSWASSASRTVSVRVLGTSGRPRVDVDAFVVVQ